MVYGTDVSSHQENKPLPKALEFVYVKATQGKWYTNPYLFSQSTNAEKNYNHRGYYHYMDNVGTPVEQARHFINMVGVKEAQQPNVELWLDFEEDYLTGNEPKLFMDEVKRLTGKQCGLYTSQNWLVGAGGKYDWSDLPKNTPIWMAMYPNTNRSGTNLTQTEINWAITAINAIPHFNQVDVWQFGDGGGFDWNYRFSNFPNTQTNAPKPKPTPTKLKLKRTAWLYESNGITPLYPNEASRNSDYYDKGTEFTKLGEVGRCYKVRSSGRIVYLRKENF